MKEILELEKRFDDLISKYLEIVNEEIRNFSKNKTLLVENYAFVLSKKVLKKIDEDFDIKIDVSIINDGIIGDMNKVIENYNIKHQNELIDYIKIEDTMLENSMDNKQKCKNVNEYLNNIRKQYMMDNNFINNLNETFTKRILTRILNTKPAISKENITSLANNIYVNVKNESFGFISELNDNYTNYYNNILSITKKICEAMAQLEMLKPYKKLDNEDELTYTSRISRMKNIIEDYDLEEGE